MAIDQGNFHKVDIDLKFTNTMQIVPCARTSIVKLLKLEEGDLS